MFSNTKLYFLQFLSENKLRNMGEDMDNFNKYTLSYFKKIILDTVRDMQLIFREWV